MATVFDVAAYILKKTGEISVMKLQKLVYYSHAWHLVWEDKPLFKQRIEAWANGPVCPDLYQWHKGQFSLRSIPKAQGSSANLTADEKESIDIVLEAYGDKSAQWLSDQTHREDPWLNARDGYSERERGNERIKDAALSEFYGSLIA